MVASPKISPAEQQAAAVYWVSLLVLLLLMPVLSWFPVLWLFWVWVFFGMLAITTLPVYGFLYLVRLFKNG